LSINSQRKPAEPLSRARYWLFLGITLAAPVLALALVEAGIRLARPDGGLPLFREAPVVRGGYVAANPDVGQRWFAGIDEPPAPPVEPFPKEKQDGDFLVFVLGESSAAGFPYPRNAAFSRLVRDAVADVLPDRRVYVVNLGIAATNSFAMLDIAREVAARRPDAVLVYAGHNEYYGALGAASRVSIPGGTSAVRLYLRLLRLRTVLAMRHALVSVRRRGAAPVGDLEAASLMEILARGRQVPLDGPMYHRGLRQFETNLESLVGVFVRNGIPVLVGSIASNLRDQPPFAAEANSSAGGAAAAFDNARAMLARGDTAAARALFARARDLDVIRFRAPTQFNDVIRRVAARPGVTYVPVAERFAARSPGGIEGSELFLEHVHPNRAGYALIGRAFFEAMLAAGVLGASPDTSRLRDWDEYLRRTAISPFDERVAMHLVRTLTSRWPFVPVARQTDYRATYVPPDLLDSLAFAVSRGARWETAKLELAADYERRQLFDSAAAEYAGFARDAPSFDEPLRLMARAFRRAGRPAEAYDALRRAEEIRPTAQGLAALAASAVDQKKLPDAIALFRRSLALDPGQPAVLYQLSLAHGMAQDLPNARATALRLARLSPGYPGLTDWLHALGLSP
jgi:tetratricopeptide (TPR) repeat protein